MVHTIHRTSRVRRSALVLTVLVLGTVVSGCGGGVSEEQKQALAKIQELGGRVNFKRGGYEVDLTKTGVEDADLTQLKHIPQLKNVDLQGTRITDAGATHLQGISTLEYVYLQRTGVTPEGVANLKKSLPKAEIMH